MHPQAAVKHGARTAARAGPDHAQRWKYTYNGVVFITDASSKKEITSWPVDGHNSHKKQRKHCVEGGAAAGPHQKRQRTAEPAMELQPPILAPSVTNGGACSAQMPHAVAVQITGAAQARHMVLESTILNRVCPFKT